jgi:hypothetical protein
MAVDLDPVGRLTLCQLLPAVPPETLSRIAESRTETNLAESRAGKGADLGVTLHDNLECCPYIGCTVRNQTDHIALSRVRLNSLPNISYLMMSRSGIQKTTAPQGEFL